LHLLETRGALKPAKRGDRRIEEKKEHRHRVLVEVELAVGMGAARTQNVKQPVKALEELEPLQVLLAQFRCRRRSIFLMAHA